VSLRQRIVLLTLAVAMLAAAPASATAADLAAPETLTLRLPDLGPNYELGSSRCGNRSRFEERQWPSTLPSLVERFPHRGCVIAFAQSWTAPGTPRRPDYAMSAAFAFADAAGPAAALQRPRAVAARILDADRRGDFKPLTVNATIGDELLAFRLGGYPKPGTVLLWRSGSVLALTLAAGRPSDRTTQAALRLATAQQARIATPTPLLPADLDDVEVPLDNPRLGVPVAWLGRELPGIGGRPPLSLLTVDGPDLRHPRLEPRAALEYGSRTPKTYVDLSLWKPRLIRSMLHGPLLRRFCARRYDASADGARATILGFPDPLRPGCQPGPPDVLQAIAFLPGVAVTIEASGCYHCRRRSPYDSVAGLRALIRALRVREAPRAPLTQ